MDSLRSTLQTQLTFLTELFTFLLLKYNLSNCIIDECFLTEFELFKEKIAVTKNFLLNTISMTLEEFEKPSFIQTLYEKIQEIERNIKDISAFAHSNAFTDYDDYNSFNNHCKKICHIVRETYGLFKEIHAQIKIKTAAEKEKTKVVEKIIIKENIVIKEVVKEIFVEKEIIKEIFITDVLSIDFSEETGEMFLFPTAINNDKVEDYCELLSKNFKKIKNHITKKTQEVDFFKKSDIQKGLEIIELKEQIISLKTEVTNAEDNLKTNRELNANKISNNKFIKEKGKKIKWKGKYENEKMKVNSLFSFSLLKKYKFKENFTKVQLFTAISNLMKRVMNYEFKILGLHQNLLKIRVK